MDQKVPKSKAFKFLSMKEKLGKMPRSLIKKLNLMDRKSGAGHFGNIR